MPDLVFSSKSDVLPPEKALNDERFAGPGCPCIVGFDTTRSVKACLVD